MISRVLLGLTVLMLGGAAACPKTQAAPEECVQACTKLALLLTLERQKQGQEHRASLDANTEEGRHNIDECAGRCENSANEKHVACLKNANTLQEWLTCDDGSSQWF